MNVYLHKKIEEKLEESKDRTSARKLLEVLEAFRTVTSVSALLSNSNIHKMNRPNGSLYMYRISGKSRLLFSINRNNETNCDEIFALDMLTLGD